MASSNKPCFIDGCKAPSRSVCTCCNKCFCLEHLSHHFGRVNNQLPPLAEKINGLGKRLTNYFAVEPAYLSSLEKWRDEAHRTIEQYYETKRQDVVDDRRDKLKKETERVRTAMEKMMRKQDAVRDDIDLMTQEIRIIEQRFNEFQSLRFTFHPLVVDNNLIVRNLLPLPSQCRTMKYKLDGSSAMAANDKFLLLHQKPHLNLIDRYFTVVKHVAWTHDDLWDACWSPKQGRFVLVTENGIFTLDPTTLKITRCSISSPSRWSRASCSDSSLYLVTQGKGPSIFEYRIPTSYRPIKEHRPPKTCADYEYIFDLKSNRKSLALVIFNSVDGNTRLDLRSSISLERHWSIDVGKGFRCCLLYDSHWLVGDPLTRRMLHISNNGKLLKKVRCGHQPWNLLQWDKYMIAVRTSEGINLH